MAEAEEPPQRPQLKLEPPKRKVDAEALRAFRDGKIRGGRAGVGAAATGRQGWDRRRAASVVILAIVALVVAAGVFAAVLPGCIRRRAIATAAENGLALSIEGVHVSPGQVVLSGIALTSAELPGMTMHAAEIEIATEGLHARRIIAKNGEIVVTGTLAAVSDAIARYRAGHLHRAANGPGADGVGAESMHVAWDSPTEGVRHVDALELRVESVPRSGDLHVQTPHLRLETARGAIGPWRYTYDREGNVTRARIGFDPALGDGPSAIVVADDSHVTSAKLAIARSPISALGLPPALLGAESAAGEATQLEADAEYVWQAPGRGSVRATLGMFALKLTRASALDAHATFDGVGDPKAGIALKHGELAIGPLKGALRGSVRVEGTPRIDLAWSAGPVPCSAFLLAGSSGAAPRGLADIADQLKQLASALGIAKVTGELRADGTLVVDGGELASSSAAWNTRSTCEASLFGR